MSFKIRNTVVLGSVWLLITIAGLFYWSFWQPRQLKKVQEELKKVNTQLEDLPGLIQDVKMLTEKFQDVKRRYDSRSKEIPADDFSSQTYAYMSHGLDEAGFMKLDMRFEGTEDLGQWGYNVYKLVQGEGQFDNLYKFIYYLENGKRLYKIRSVKFTQDETVDPETKDTKKTLKFEIEFHAYFTRIPELGSSLAAKALPVTRAPYDPFNPLILRVISAEAPPDEMNVEQADVKAVLPGKVFIQYKEDLVVLQLGDKVWRGYVSRIDPSTSKVEFTLDEGGVIRRVEKVIKFDKRIKRQP